MSIGPNSQNNIEKSRNTSTYNGLDANSCPLGPIVKITLKSQETQAVTMGWMFLLLRSRNTIAYNGLDAISNGRVEKLEQF